MEIFDIAWVIVINFLILPVTIYYCLMIERFIRVLSINYKIRKFLSRLIIYFTAAYINWIYLSAGVIQFYIRIYSSKAYYNSCFLKVLNHTNWYGNLVFSNILRFLILLSIGSLKSVENDKEENDIDDQNDEAFSTYRYSSLNTS